MVDQVKVVADEEASSEQSLRRNLTNRHIQLIAIGGAIGTGLFMGSGKTISLAGPSIIFVYMIIGFMLFFVMRAMGELLLSNLEYKSFSDFRPARAMGGLFHRLDLLVLLGRDRYGGRRGDNRLCAVLVPRAVGLGGLAGGYCSAAEPEPRHR